MTQLVLVRHGETVWHAENRYAGSTDVALTPVGVQQAERLAAWARTAGLAAVWSSDLRRAQDTAARAASACGLGLHADARLAELDFGRAEGLTREEMRGRFPDAVDAFQDDAVAHHLPGGEDPHRAVARAREALDELAVRHPSGRVLVVAHTTLIRLVLCDLLGLELGRYRHVLPSVENVALTEVRLGDGPAALLRFNARLPADEDLGAPPQPRAHTARAPASPTRTT